MDFNQQLKGKQGMLELGFIGAQISSINFRYSMTNRLFFILQTPNMNQGIDSLINKNVFHILQAYAYTIMVPSL
jgi:hypothetical protein